MLQPTDPVDLINTIFSDGAHDFLLSTGDSQLDNISREAARLSKDAKELEKVAQELGETVPHFLKDLLESLIGPFDDAMRTLLTLIEVIKRLAKGEHNSDYKVRLQLIAKAKARSKEVKICFDGVYALDAKALERAGELDTRVMHFESQAETKARKVSDLLTLSADIEKSTKVVEKQQQDQREVYARAMETARDAIEEAEHKLRSTIASKKLRSSLWFVGELIDIGGLNSTINTLRQTIATSEDAYRSASESYSQVLQRHQATLRTLYAIRPLQANLSSLKGAFSEERKVLDEGRTTMNGVVKNIFDLSLVLGNLSARASPLPFTSSASRLAQAVIGIHKILRNSQELSGVLYSNPGSLDDALTAIAESDVEPDDGLM